MTTSTAAHCQAADDKGTDERTSTSIRACQPEIDTAGKISASPTAEAASSSHCDGGSAAAHCPMTTSGLASSRTAARRWEQQGRERSIAAAEVFRATAAALKAAMLGHALRPSRRLARAHHLHK